MSVGSIRLSKKSVEQLTQLTRHTGIQHRNVLCRWALAVSLADPTEPGATHDDVAVSIDWETFVGGLDAAVSALVRLRLGPTAATDKSLAAVDAHIARGIARLSAVRGVSELVRKA